MEQLEVLPELIVAVVMVAFDGGVLDGAVHPLDLAIGPRMVRLGEPMRDAVLGADLVKAMHAEASGPAVPIARQVGELDAIVGQDGMQIVGYGLDQRFQEPHGGWPVSLVVQLGESELAGAVDGDIEVKLALLGTHLGDVDVGPQATPEGR